MSKMSNRELINKIKKTRGSVMSKEKNKITSMGTVRTFIKAGA